MTDKQESSTESKEELPNAFAHFGLNGDQDPLIVTRTNNA